MIISFTSKYVILLNGYITILVHIEWIVSLMGYMRIVARKNAISTQCYVRKKLLACVRNVEMKIFPFVTLSLCLI